MSKDMRMHRLVAVFGWGALCTVAVWVAIRGFLIDEGAAMLGWWGLFLGGIALRVWMRSPSLLWKEAPADSLSTGEMTAQRLADMEARIYELEERLELTERLLAESREQARLPHHREVTPV